LNSEKILIIKKREKAQHPMGIKAYIYAALIKES